MLLFLTLGCRARCESIDDVVDYSDEDNWICLPGREDLCTDTDIEVREVLADGSVVDIGMPVAEDPPYDCFYVYPTMDLRVRTGVHEDLTDVEGPERAITGQARWLRQHCRLYVPNYRQVTYGTYFKREVVSDGCFEVAYGDAEAAWEHYLQVYNQGRPVMLYGHSQGGQITSRLFREREDDQVLATYAIGWPVDAALQCNEPGQTGCMVGFKTHLNTDQLPDSASYAEGDEVACVDPSGDGVLSAVFVVGSEEDTDLDIPVGATVVYRDAFLGECVSGEAPDAGLEISWRGEDERENPIDWELSSINGSNGSHVLDVQFTLVDIGEDMDRRHGAWASE